MRAANVNKPQGPKYAQAFNAWLEEQGFRQMPFPVRTACCRLVDNLREIELWRATAPGGDKWHHPQVLVRNWRRDFAPGRRQVEPRPRNTTQAKTLRKNQKPIFWSQDILRAAAEGIRMANSHDIYVVARAVLDHAFPSRDALIDVLNEKPLHPNPHQGKAPADADAAVQAA
jgi:hypothetical protein